MRRAAVDARPLEPKDEAQLDLAYDLLTLMLDATPLVMVMEDERGVFLHFPNGRERELVALLRDTDWEPTVRLIQEHTDP